MIIISETTMQKFKKWLEIKHDADISVPRVDVLKFLQGFPDEEWIRGIRMICLRKGNPLVAITYLEEKYEIFYEAGVDTRSLDYDSKNILQKLKSGEINVSTMIEIMEITNDKN